MDSCVWKGMIKPCFVGKQIYLHAIGHTGMDDHIHTGGNQQHFLVLVGRISRHLYPYTTSWLVCPHDKPFEMCMFLYFSRSGLKKERSGFTSCRSGYVARFPFSKHNPPGTQLSSLLSSLHNGHLPLRHFQRLSFHRCFEDLFVSLFIASPRLSPPMVIACESVEITYANSTYPILS